MIAGVELVRRKSGKNAYCMTNRLLTTSTGEKMGKTVGGALWLDKEKTSTYDFYQYWRNVADADVKNCLALLTFLPMDEVNRLGALQDAAINEAKKVLAFEVTKLVHGEEEAKKAQEAAEALFGGAGVLDNVPTLMVAESEIDSLLIDFLVANKVFTSKREARQMIAQGGLYVNDAAVTDALQKLSKDLFVDDGVLVRKGKKKYYRLVLNK